MTSRCFHYFALSVKVLLLIGVCGKYGSLALAQEAPPEAPSEPAELQARPVEDFALGFDVEAMPVLIPERSTFEILMEDDLYWYIAITDGRRQWVTGWPKIEAGPRVLGDVLMFPRARHTTFKEAYLLFRADETFGVRTVNPSTLIIEYPLRSGQIRELRVPRARFNLIDPSHQESPMASLRKRRSQLRTLRPESLAAARVPETLLYPTASSERALGFRLWLDGNHYAIVPAEPDHRYSSALFTARGRRLDVVSAEEAIGAPVARLLLGAELSPALVGLADDGRGMRLVSPPGLRPGANSALPSFDPATGAATALVAPNGEETPLRGLTRWRLVSLAPEAPE